jgi:hypothetical protein
MKPAGHKRKEQNMGFGSAFGTGLGFNIANKLTGSNSSKNFAKAEKARAKADVRMNDAIIDAKQRSEGLRSVMNVSFAGDAADIASSLANLISIIAANVDTGEDVCAAAFKKLEVGIVLLRGKGDAATADYFQ